jgi:anti-anti-sigma factor
VRRSCGGRQRLTAFTRRTDGGGDINDSATFETTRREVRTILVKLRGEFDVLSQKILAGTLSDCLASGRLTFVDLSGVTFMDSRCVRELAVYYQLGKGRVALCDPSQELKLSVAACDLEDWIDFVYTTGNAAASTSHDGRR